MSKSVTLYKKFNDMQVEELYQILQIRSEVFNVEQGILCNDLDGMDISAIHAKHIVNNTLVGYLRIIEGNTVKIGRLCVLKEYRRNYYASNLIADTLIYIERNFPKRDIEIVSQTYIKNLYKKWNFIEVGDEFDIFGQRHIKMIKKNSENTI